jgi:hypothetical protein
MSIHNATMPIQDASDTDSSKKDAAIWFAALLKAETIHRGASHATLLAWVMSLPCYLDPSLAAASVLDHQRDHAGTSLSEQLTVLLRDVAICSRQRLERLRSGRRQAQTALAN